MKKVLLFFLACSVLMSCHKEPQLLQFTVGDITIKQTVQSTEGEAAPLKINSYSDGNLPSGVSLSWNGVQGLSGEWAVEVNYNNTKPKCIMQLVQGDTVISEFTPQIGTHKIKTSFVANGDAVGVRVLGDTEVGINLIFKHLK